jgi:hypothetical protein
MEENEQQDPVAWLEKVVTELTQNVYRHALEIASLRREYGLHYHLHEGKSPPQMLRADDPQLPMVTAIAGLDKKEIKQQIEAYDRDPQTYLKSNYSDLFYWPWE